MHGPSIANNSLLECITSMTIYFLSLGLEHKMKFEFNSNFNNQNSNLTSLIATTATGVGLSQISVSQFNSSTLRTPDMLQESWINATLIEL